MRCVTALARAVSTLYIFLDKNMRGLRESQSKQPTQMTRTALALRGCTAGTLVLLFCASLSIGHSCKVRGDTEQWYHSAPICARVRGWVNLAEICLRF